MRSPGNPPLAVRALSLLKKVLETKAMLDQTGITEQYAALCSASGQAFYNTSKFSLRKWGSCSSAGTVTLASDLVDQDPRFQDFVSTIGPTSRAFFKGATSRPCGIERSGSSEFTCSSVRTASPSGRG
ncbi:MAG TPA: hypothetical protein VFZ09_40845 [Archangium sp.]|uniref:hypothetical protein n=1 Tax=Archangium sp. TaxID=1872627 RepID=UPI002E2FAADF|nr:hypothetical protein [Archangium sp.]HEX5752624.1 hypothetical protein [Archangium sp.]